MICKQVRVIPHEKPNHWKKTYSIIPIPTLTHSRGYQLIHYVGKPWLHKIPEKLLIEKTITNRDSHALLVTILNRWSVTQFSKPFLSLISQSNSWSSIHHLINLCFASFFSVRCFKVAWSGENNYMVPYEVGPKIFKSKNYRQKTLFLVTM